MYNFNSKVVDNMNRKQKIIVSITGITVVLLALLGLTYGYYLTNIYGNTNTNSISITTANLKLTYGNGTGELIASGVMPGDEIASKTFTVTNEGQDIEAYTVALINIVNDFTFPEDLEVSVSCSSNINSGVCEGFAEDYEDNIYKETYPTINSELFSLGIKEKEIQTFTLTVNYLYQNYDQSDDMGKTLKGKVQIYDPKDTIEVSGTVTGASDGDYAEIHSDVQTSEIIDGEYKFIGVPADNHTVYIKNRNTDNSKSTTLEIKKGTTEGVENNVITFIDTSKVANVVIDATNTELSATANSVNDGTIRNYELYVSSTNAIGLRLLEQCLDGTYCDGPYTVTIKNGMTLNDWWNSSYADEVKTNRYMTTGLEIKNNTYAFTSHCSSEILSGLIDTEVYHNVDTAFGNVVLYEVENDAIYIDSLQLIGYSDNSIILNDILQIEGSILVLENDGICYTCLPPNTLIEVEEEDEKGKKKRKKKKLRDIKVGDKVVCINPYTKELDVDVVVDCDTDQIKKHNEYDIWVFNDGTIITTVHRHRFYNIEKQKFTYMDEWNIGEHGYNINGEKIKLIEHHHKVEEIEHCTLFTEKYNNYYANGMLSGNRNSSEINL